MSLKFHIRRALEREDVQHFAFGMRCLQGCQLAMICKDKMTYEQGFPAFMVGGPPQFLWRPRWRQKMRGEPEKKLASARFKYHQLVFGYYSWFVKSQCETNVRRAQNGKSFFSQLLVNYISMYNTYLLSLQKHHNLLRSFSRNCTSCFRAICGKFSCCF